MRTRKVIVHSVVQGNPCTSSYTQKMAYATRSYLHEYALTRFLRCLVLEVHGPPFHEWWLWSADSLRLKTRRWHRLIYRGVFSPTYRHPRFWNTGACYLETNFQSVLNGDLPLFEPAENLRGARGKWKRRGPWWRHYKIIINAIRIPSDKITSVDSQQVNKN